MRRRSGPENPAARTALARYMTASSIAWRQGLPRTGPGASGEAGAGVAARQVSSSSRLRRCSVASSSASSHCASSACENRSRNSSARSVVAGVPGSRRSRRRSPISPNRSTRAEKPKSASRAAASISCQKRASSAATRSRCSALRSSTLSKWRRRSAGSGWAPSAGLESSSPPVGAWRNHSSRRISHRCRSGSAACGSAALSRADKSHAGVLLPNRSASLLFNARLKPA